MNIIKVLLQYKYITAILLLTIAASMLGIGLQSASAASLPCDIYGSCVAAHSTVRALKSSYSGRLYQIKRASNGNTMDIGTLAAGGYANAAAQDSFCAGTTCTITQIYDQSGRGNNLGVAPAGGVCGADSPSNANAKSITLAGHKVYALVIAQHNGYRDNSTSGIPTGSGNGSTYAVFGARIRTLAAASTTAMPRPTIWTPATATWGHSTLASCAGSRRATDPVPG